MNLTEYVSYVRDLTGVYMSDIISDNLIKRFVNEAYIEVCLYDDWRFMERLEYLNLPAGSHFVSTGTGVQKVQELVVRNADSSLQVQGEPVTSALRFTEKAGPLRSSATVFFDVAEDQVQVYPAFEDDTVVEVRYQAAPVQLTQDTDVPVFRSDFHPMLAYRAAGKVLAVMADETERSSFYGQEYASYLERLRSEYLLDHTEGAFSLNSSDKISRFQR